MSEGRLVCFFSVGVNPFRLRYRHGEREFEALTEAVGPAAQAWLESGERAPRAASGAGLFCCCAAARSQTDDCGAEPAGLSRRPPAELSGLHWDLRDFGATA